MFKKTLTMLTMCALMLGTVMVVPTWASNYQDTSFNFTMDTKDVYSELRMKTDSSSVYLKCTKSSRKGAQYNAKVYGASTKNAKKKNLSNGHTYTLKAGEYKYMINEVSERGYAYAWIRASRNYMYSCTFSNLWSPDSI